MRPMWRVASRPRKRQVFPASVDFQTPKLDDTLPRTVKALAAWDPAKTKLPDEAVYKAMADDLKEARKAHSLAIRQREEIRLLIARRDADPLKGAVR